MGPVDTMRILVTGWRKWGCLDALRDEESARFRAILPDAEARRLVLEGLVTSSGQVSGRTLIHGDANGLDRLAAAVASELGYVVETHPALWWTDGRFDRGAGPKRNQRMVDAGADLCLAFPGPESVGTWDCARRARKAGILVVVIGPFARWGEDPKDPKDQKDDFEIIL